MGKFKHGYGSSANPTYMSWQAMKARCSNTNTSYYKDYGGRGIAVCAEWSNDFGQFLKDMGERPEGRTLDRIDNDKGYEPGNCRWATNLEQAHNKRDVSFCRKVNVDGMEFVSLTAAASHFGISRNTVSNRITMHGWEVERALKTPAGKRSPSL